MVWAVGSRSLDPRTTERLPAAVLKTVLEGRYQLERKLGSGGMSTVYLARDLRFDTVERWCAVKEMVNSAQEVQTRRLNQENFQREANILASLNHPAIPKVFDFFSQESRSYLVMEFVEGTDLEEVWTRTRAPLSPNDVVNWALQICDVLEYLHGQSPPVIFRDVKPSNVMLTGQERVMLIDFGIAKVFRSGIRGTMIGTEGYAPPEQYRGIAEPNGDVYALGATMHHLLTGKDPRLEPPFTFHERPIRQFNADVSDALAAVIDRTLRYDAAERFESARELSRALANAHQGVVGGTLNLNSAFTSHGSRAASTPGATGSINTADGVRALWQFECEEEVRSSPRVGASLLYIGCYDHNLYALDASSGRFVWKFPSEGGISSTPLVTVDALYVGSEDNSLYALEPKSGNLLWRAVTRGPIRSSPRPHGDVIVIGSDDGCVYALRASDGVFVWRFQALQAVRSSALIVNDVAIIGCDDGHVYGVNMRDGRQRWKYNAGRFVISTPAYEDGMAIFGAGDSAVHAVDVRSGWSIWRVRTGGPIVSSPAIANGIVYVGSADGRLYALEARSGRTVWNTPVGSQIASSPCVSNDVVYFGSEDGKVHALDAKKGKPRWKFVTNGMITSSPLVHDGKLFIGSTDHRVYALPAA